MPGSPIVSGVTIGSLRDLSPERNYSPYDFDRLARPPLFAVAARLTYATATSAPPSALAMNKRERSWQRVAALFSRLFISNAPTQPGSLQQ